MIKYSNYDKGYFLADNFQTIASKKLSDSEIELYNAGFYSRLFPAYNSQTDIVRISEEFADWALLVRKTKTQEKLKPGSYFIKFHTRYGEIAQPITLDSDTYVSMGNGVSALQDDMKLFRENKPVYDELGLVYKRGALLYGVPGTGKTTVIKQVLKDDDQSYLFIVDRNVYFSSMLNWMQAIIPGGMTVFVIEEIVERTEYAYDREDLLSFLDGEFSWPNSYVIATTNNPEKLAPNLLNRPGRFDLLLEIGLPSRNDRRVYLTQFMEDVSDSLLDATEGFTIAYLKEMVARMALYKITAMLAVSQLLDMQGTAELLKENNV